MRSFESGHCARNVIPCRCESQREAPLRRRPRKRRRESPAARRFRRSELRELQRFLERLLSDRSVERSRRVIRGRPPTGRLAALCRLVQRERGQSLLDRGAAGTHSPAHSPAHARAGPGWTRRRGERARRRWRWVLRRSGLQRRQPGDPAGRRRGQGQPDRRELRRARRAVPDADGRASRPVGLRRATRSRSRRCRSPSSSRRAGR